MVFDHGIDAGRFVREEDSVEVEYVVGVDNVVDDDLGERATFVLIREESDDGGALVFFCECQETLR